MPALVLALVLTAEAAGAAPAPARLRWDPRIDLPVAGVLAGGWALSELALKKPLAPDACGWCATNGFDTAVRRLFNPSLAPSAFGVHGPDTASNVVGFAALPVAVLGIDGLLAWLSGGTWRDFLVDGVLVLEATFAALLLNQVVKFAVARARPYTIGATPEELAGAKDPKDHYLSFFSGHSTFAFGLAVSAGMVATLRGYRHAWLAWAVGLPLAATTALLRLAADKHWASDILVGLAVGAGTAVAIPLVFHGREQAPAVSVSVLPNGVALSGRF